MQATIWYMRKPGETRTFSSTTPFSPEWLALQRAEGWKVYEVSFFLPDTSVLARIDGSITAEEPAVVLP